MYTTRGRRIIVALLAWLCLVTPLSAAQSPAPKWSELAKAVGKEDYAEAKKLADAILQRGSPPDRLKTTVIYGRILLALGDKEQAKQYLATLSKPGNDPSGGQMTAIYTAWFTALDGKPDEGIKTLEKLLADDKSHNEMAAEAADVLAMLYMARGDQEKAKKAVDRGMQILQYLSKKDGYLLALLRGRLSSNIVAGQAKRMYDAAEKLRAEKKFAEAGQLFAQVRAMYPNDQYSHASGFQMGECLLGLDRPSQAATHWQKFIKESPAGPWRGQAHVALVDLTLGSTLDVKKATEFTMTASAILAKGLGKDAESSWKEAAYDIYLRQGIVSLVDGRFDAAAQAFEQAKQAGGASSNPASLDRLIEAAKQKAKLIPDELGVGDDRATVALALGNIFNILHQYDIAKGYFTLPLSGPMRSRSAAHRSFAGLGLARALTADQKTGSGKSETSKSANLKSPNLSSPPSPIAVYEASLKEFPNGSWHDETLYRLATMTQDQADAKFGKSSKPASGKKTNPPATPLSPQERTVEAKAEKERLAALSKAKTEALSYWQEIIQRFPQSLRCEQAFYYAGVLLYEMANSASADKSEQLWQDAASRLKRFCETYPQSPYAGDAYVRQIDIALERMYDPKAALGVSTEAGQWAKWAIGAPTLDSPKSPTWALVLKYPDKSEIRRAVYDCLLRLGVVAYLAGDFDGAVKWVDIAGPKPPAAGFTANPDMESLTLYYLQKAIRSKKPLTEPQALEAATTDEQRLLLQLGDLYLETIRPDKAEKVFLRIIEHDPRLGKVSASLEGYAMLQIATALDRQPDRRAEALEWLKKLATRRDLQGTYWGGYGLFRLALFTYNQTQDPKRSMPLYLEMLKRYPDHETAELALLYYCLEAIQLKDMALAEKASQNFFVKYPKSEFRSLLEKKMDGLAKLAGSNNTSR